MVTAKVFAVFAVLFGLCATLGRLVLPGAYSAVDIAIRDTYFAVGPLLVLLYCAVASINFALLYYAAERFFHARWNRAMSFLHAALFLCFGISLSVVFGVTGHAGNGGSPGEAIHWVFVPFFLGIFCLTASFAVFAANLTLTVVQIVRARFAGH